MNFKNKVLFISLLSSIALWHCRSKGEPGGDTPPANPDLTVEISANPTNSLPSAEVTLEATVSNMGEGPSPETTLRWYHSADDSLDTETDTSSGMEAVGSLAAAASITIRNVIMVPGEIGTNHYFACVDEVTDEADTANNCSLAATVNVVPVPVPDLAVEISAGSTDVTPSEMLTLTATVMNMGTGSSDATTLEWYLSTDDTLDTDIDTRVGTPETVNTLEADASQTIPNSDTIMAPMTAGTWYYFACVDAVADDTDANNDCSSGAAVDVTVPDLAVVVMPSSTNEVTSAELTLTATVSNMGRRASDATTLRWYLSNDEDITTADTEQGATPTGEAVGILAAGADEMVSNTNTIMTPMTVGTYYYGACVTQATLESNTMNNCSPGARVVVTVRPVPDLSVTISASSADVAPSGMLTLTATVSNTGTGASPETTLRWYRSDDNTLEITGANVDDSQGTKMVSTVAAGGSVMISESMITAPSMAGTWYYFACVDAVAYDTDADNDCSSTGAAVEVTAPDLIVNSIAASSASVATSAELTLTATVMNTGRRASPMTTLQWYRSTDMTIETSDDSTGSAVDVAGLMASSTSDTLSSSMVTVPMTAGTYYYGACVTSVTHESDTTNNCSSGVEVVVTAPDLTVVSISASSTSVTTSETLTLTATVMNAGGATDDTSTLTWYRSDDNTLETTGADADDSQGTEMINALAAGASQMVSDDMITAPSMAGTYYYFACVAPVTDETDMSNDCSASPADVTVTAPDLTVVSISASSTSVTTSETLTLMATVMNAGGATDDTSTLTWYLSGDNDITTTADNTSEGTETVNALMMGDNQALTNNVTTPMTTGAWYYFACVAAVTDETDESNNCASVEVTVTAPDIDVSISASSTSVTTSSMLTLTAMVMNTGGATDDTPTLTWYLSGDNDITTTADNTSEGTETVNALMMGDNQTLTNNVTAPMTTGTWYYFACVAAVTDEANESNNCASVEVMVTVRPAFDFTVSITRVNPANVVPGGMTTLMAVVRNGGSNPSPATDLKWYRSTDSSITTADTQEGMDVDVVALAANANSDAISNTITVSSTAGTYYYGACVVTAASESDTNNNCSSGAAVVVSTSTSGGRLSAIEITAVDSASNEEPIDIWSDGETMWVADFEDDKLYAYNLATGARDSAKEFDLQYAADIADLSDETPRGIWSDGITMWVSDSAADRLFAYTLATGARDPAKEFNLHKDNSFAGAIWSDGTIIWVLQTLGGDKKLFAYVLATGARDPDKDITLTASNANPSGLWSDGTTFWVLDISDNAVYSYQSNGNRDTTRNLSLASGNSNARGIWSDGFTLWVGNEEATDNDMAENIYAYDIRSLVTP